MKFGILGEAKIAREHVVPAIINAGHEVTHVGRRKPGQAALPAIYGNAIETDYESLIKDPSIDAIYNPLPNHLHVPYSIEALKSNKHVLCEKPVALNLKELAQLENAAKESKAFFYEAFMVRSHPQWQWLQSLDIGKYQSSHFIFSYPKQPDGNVRNLIKYGGGPLFDIGCYAILSGCMLFKGNPTVLSAVAVMCDQYETEKQVDATLRWPDGETLNFTVSANAALCQAFTVLGSNGWAKLNVPVNPPEKTSAYWSKGGLQEGKQVEFPACNHYQLMVEDFVTSSLAGDDSDFLFSRTVTKAINDIQKIAGLAI
jgi:predicted dehydrogenase